ncbi:MAG TPA: hypothetical protein PK760_04505, partial [Flavobacteriales bacterium]|nr:hypothetical protein [Flavobacteriales bacterium]
SEAMTVVSVTTVLLSSVIKFILAPVVSFGFGHTLLQTILLTTLGGCIGMIAFLQVGKRLLKVMHALYIRRRAKRVAKGLPPKPIFTRINRWIVRVKRNYGLLSIALAPPILSIPVTAILAAKYFQHDKRTLPVLLAAVAGWSVVLSTAWGIFR